MAQSIVMATTAVLLAVVTFWPALLRSSQWRATVTPLASIIGSGFLVAGPVLAHAAGRWAWLAMAALCALAYLFGAAIRGNIRHVEPLLVDSPPRWLVFLDHASDLALAFAYFVSVAYYLSLFASFGLRAGGIIDEQTTRIASTAVIVALGAIGATRGLRGLEHVELAAVGLKLAVIGGIIAALAVWSAGAWQAGNLEFKEFEHMHGTAQLRVLLGLVILVQGFETSRYLGNSYDAETRIRTMRRAQWMTTAIYIVFIALLTPFFTSGLPESGGETAIIDMLKPLGFMVAPFIIITALASQLSAAIADMNGAGGLLASASAERVPVKWGYAATAAAAIFITWSANIFEIIAFASRAFVVFYGLQSAIAVLMALRGEHRQPWRAALFAVAVVIALSVVVFAVPAEGR